MVYWKTYNQVKKQYGKRSTGEIWEAITDLQRQVGDIFASVDNRYIDTPFYEYMIGDIENTIGAFFELYDEKGNEWALLTYNQRQGKQLECLD